MQMQNRELILVKRGYLIVQPKSETPQWAAYYAAKLLNTFGIMVNRPKRVTQEHVKLISDFYGINIPKSFYSNPQDLKYFTSTELLIEQIVSYINIELVDGVFSDDPSTFERIEIFRKALPNYREGDEVVFRNYKIINESESTEVLRQIASDLALYTRKWSETESEEFQFLFDNKFLDSNIVLKSKDNGIEMFKKYEVAQFAKSLDQKDVVKLSVEMIGEQKNLEFTPMQKRTLNLAIRNCYATTLTKKQAKYFSQLTNKIDKRVVVDNSRSPYKKAKEFIDNGQVLDAAKVFAKNGSLLERNLVWLLSRARIQEILPIVELIKIKNPIVAIQLLENLTAESQGPRTFKFYNSRKVKNHVETPTEVRNRKSVLSKGIKDELTKAIYKQIDQYYMDLPKFGKVYVSEAFDRIPVPFNTSASGSGLDVMPVGARTLLTERKVRAFVYWKDVYDIDASATLLLSNGRIESVGFYNYYAKQFSDAVLYSGDNRSSNGAEYIDFDLDKLAKYGVEHIVFGINGYASDFTKGEVYSGYQLKKDLNTVAWQPNNIQMKVKVSGNARAFFVFAIDLVKQETVVINQMSSSGHPVLNQKDVQGMKQLLDSRFVEMFNVGRIARLRATELVTDPALADVVFDKDYVALKEQKVVRPSDIEKIVAMLK
jgi:stress response protein SCP2